MSGQKRTNSFRTPSTREKIQNEYFLIYFNKLLIKILSQTHRLIRYRSRETKGDD
jgi:hypothetical protein